MFTPRKKVDLDQHYLADLRYTQRMDRNDLFRQAHGIAVETWNTLVNMYPGKLGVFPTVKFNNRLKTTAGRMYVQERICELSPEIMEYNLEGFVKEIIPHELIHQVDWDINGKTWDLNRIPWHGTTWKQIMVEFGLSPNRLHSFENPAQAKRKAARK